MSTFKFYILSIWMAAILLLPFQAYAYHAKLDGLLKSYVHPATSKGIDYLAVDYDAWVADERHLQVMDEILGTHPDTLESQSSKKAFWINAYNVLAIDMITRTGEREAVNNLGDALKSPFSTYKWKIGGHDYTLDQIENDILRPMKDPRIHFAINSATITCPDLRREAYRAARLEGQLRDQVLVTFKNSTKGIQFDGDIVRVPQFMNTHKMDFKNGDLKSWMQGYYPEHIDADTQIGFFQRDWTLNRLPSEETAVNQ